MSAITEAIDYISSAELAQLLALCVNTIIIIFMVYLGVSVGKRLLKEASGETMPEPGEGHIDDDGQLWMDGEPTGYFYTEDEIEEQAEKADSSVEDGEDWDFRECDECGRENSLDEINSDGRCQECGASLSA